MDIKLAVMKNEVYTSLFSLHLVPPMFRQLTWGNSAERYLSQQCERWREIIAVCENIEELVLSSLHGSMQKSARIWSLKMVSEKQHELLCRLFFLADNHALLCNKMPYTKHLYDWQQHFAVYSWRGSEGLQSTSFFISYQQLDWCCPCNVCQEITGGG